MSLGAEYTLKQSKLHMSVDSNMLLKSSLESTLAPGVTMQFAAEMMQAKDHFKFGYGIVMG
jgi:Eukaryotic porin